MLRRASLAPFVVLAFTACSDDEPTTPSGPALGPNDKLGEIRQAETWKDGTKLVGRVTIFDTVTIEPGAKITCTDDAEIQVAGTLKVKSADKHASISCASWAGIIAASKGKLELDGLDIENAARAIETTPGSTGSYSNGTIKLSTRPFTVRANSTLTVTKATVTTPETNKDNATSVSEVFGTFTAKFLDYDANKHEGIMTMAGGVTDIEDSNLHGQGALDLVSSYGGKSLKVRYTTMSGGHCGPHIAQARDAQGNLDPNGAPTESFEFDHITSENTYGITIYAASDAGPHVVKDSNFKGLVAWLDIKGAGVGPVTFQNVWWEGVIDRQDRNADPPVNTAPAKIANAVPR